MTLQAFVGQTRWKPRRGEPEIVSQLRDADVGECTQRGELDPRRWPWFHDCKTFADWCDAGRPLGEASAATMPQRFDSVQWSRDQRRIRVHLDFPDRAPVPPPSFIVVPDMVAAGAASLAFSAYWRSEIDERIPAYVAVQNGMTEDEVSAAIDEQRYGGVFVGGDTPWKLETGAAWVRFAHARGLPCHIGRCGPPDRVLWAGNIGADSIDSSLPLRHKCHLDGFLAALRQVNHPA